MATPKSNPEMEIITINIPKKLNIFMKRLKKWGLIPSRSEVLRNACLELCLKYKDLMDTIDEELEQEETEYIPDTKYLRIPNGDGTFDVREILRRLE